MNEATLIIALRSHNLAYVLYKSNTINNLLRHALRRMYTRAYEFLRHLNIFLSVLAELTIKVTLSLREKKACDSRINDAVLYFRTADNFPGTFFDKFSRYHET